MALVSASLQLRDAPIDLYRRDQARPMARTLQRCSQEQIQLRAEVDQNN